MMLTWCLFDFLSLCKTTIGPSNTATESSFNGLKMIHTSQRNRLGKDKIQKLLKVWFNGKIVDREAALMKNFHLQDCIDYRRLDRILVESEDGCYD